MMNDDDDDDDDDVCLKCCWSKSQTCAHSSAWPAV